MLCRNALFEHASRFGFDDGNVYVGDCLYVGENGEAKTLHRARVDSFEDLIDIKNIWRAKGCIVQPEVLFPRELALAVGGVDRRRYYGMDYELWGKFFLKGARFKYTEIPTGIFRKHRDQKTADSWESTKVLIDVAKQLVTAAADLPETSKQRLLTGLNDYKDSYWRQFSVLSRIGLPPKIVLPVRDVIIRLRYTPLGTVLSNWKNSLKIRINA
jgi:hypothetical protein